MQRTGEMALTTFVHQIHLPATSRQQMNQFVIDFIFSPAVALFCSIIFAKLGPHQKKRYENFTEFKRYSLQKKTNERLYVISTSIH